MGAYVIRFTLKPPNSTPSLPRIPILILLPGQFHLLVIIIIIVPGILHTFFAGMAISLSGSHTMTSLSHPTSLWLFFRPTTCRRFLRTKAWSRRLTIHSGLDLYPPRLQHHPRFRYNSTMVSHSHSSRSKEPPLADSPPVVIPKWDEGMSGVASSSESANRTARQVPPEADRAKSSVQAQNSAQQPAVSRSRLRPSKAAISLTPAAVSRLRTLVSGPTPQLIRIGVRNKGCAGMSYHLDYVEGPSKFDEVVEQDGVKVLIDSKALFSIIGSEMDWKEDKLSSKFAFKNPNIKDACGCGESFNI